MSKFRSNPGPVPDRWMHCPRKANGLIDKFMAFKTPLSANFDPQIPPECRFSPNMLFKFCRRKKIKLGMWIDLTNTERFYDKQEVEDEECHYVKLQCRGHGECPSEDQTRLFIKVVSDFITKNPLEAIAVHCTHGFNRTGFLIVSYLVTKIDCSLEIALDMFAKIRPPGIYKGHYIEELYRRYDDIEDAPPPPEKPVWASEEDNESKNEVEDENFRNIASTSTAKLNNVSKKKKSLPQFMEGVHGVEPFVEQPQSFHLQKKVKTMCGWKRKDFPGCQPVTLDWNNIKLLHEKPYMVSWKADGMRYLMLIDGVNEVYFFDRDFNVFKVNGLFFPYRKDHKQHLRDTLLDGEMVIDKVNGADIPRYLAYDIVQFLGQEVGKTPFTTRLHCLDNEIFNPRVAAMESGQINKAAEPFSIRKKHFWDVTQAANLLGEKFAKTLSHEPDGLIFQPAKDPYVAGRCDEVLKWKPVDLNSVDFKMQIVKTQREGCLATKIIHLYVGQSPNPFATMKYDKQLKDLDGKIIECKYQNHQWIFMRERTDKSFPNAYTTAKSVCDSILNPVTKDKLLEYINAKRFPNDREMMPPPSKKIKR